MQEKSHRRMLMMLRGGSAPLQIETGRWKGVPREERLCRECGMNEVEDCDYWLLWCSRWDIERRHLLTNVQQRFPNHDLICFVPFLQLKKALLGQKRFAK